MQMPVSAVYYESAGSTPTIKEEVIVVEVDIVPTKENLVVKFANAIKEHEGYYLNSRAYRNNNPGNLRYSPLQDGTLGGFSYFNTYEKGWEALILQITMGCDGRSKVYNTEMTIVDFFNQYAPSSDSNNPYRYAEVVAGKLGLDKETKMLYVCN